MLEDAQQGNATACQARKKIARKARQNPERSFRMRLEYKPLQKREGRGRL
jgi:hypothetical protein